MPQPDIMVVPLRMFVIVAGNSSAVGLCVVIPTSMLPDHLSTRRSIRICHKTEQKKADYITEHVEHKEIYDVGMQFRSFTASEVDSAGPVTT
jgi:hypothetical protein